MSIELIIRAENGAQLGADLIAFAALFSGAPFAPAEIEAAAIHDVEVEVRVVEPQRRTRGPNKPKDEPKAEEVKAETPEAPVEEPKTVLQSGVEVPALTYDDDVKPAFLRLAMQKGRERVFAILAEFGAEKSASEIEPEEWPNVLIRVDEELAKA